MSEYNRTPPYIIKAIRQMADNESFGNLGWNAGLAGGMLHLLVERITHYFPDKATHIAQLLPQGFLWKDRTAPSAVFEKEGDDLPYFQPVIVLASAEPKDVVGAYFYHLSMKMHQGNPPWKYDPNKQVTFETASVVWVQPLPVNEGTTLKDAPKGAAALDVLLAYLVQYREVQDWLKTGGVLYGVGIMSGNESDASPWKIAFSRGRLQLELLEPTYIVPAGTVGCRLCPLD